jgi:hypothetical protein
LTGAISGVIPAIKASKINPVDALRYEWNVMLLFIPTRPPLENIINDKTWLSYLIKQFWDYDYNASFTKIIKLYFNQQ